MLKNRILLMLFPLVFFNCKKSFKNLVDIKVEVIREIHLPSFVSKIILYKNYKIYSNFRTPVYMEDINTGQIDTIGRIGEGPGEFRYVLGKKVKNDKIFITAGGHKFLIFSLKNKKIVKELNFMQTFGFIPGNIEKVIDDSILLLKSIDISEARKENLQSSFPFIIVDIKNGKIIEKFYIMLTHPDRKVRKLLLNPSSPPYTTFYLKDTFYTYDYIKDEIIIYDIKKDIKEKIKLYHKDFTLPPALKIKHMGRETYKLPFDPSKGLFKKDSFLILFVMNEWKDNWKIVKKTAERFSGFTEEEKKKFNLLIDYISLKKMKHIGTFIFPDSLWKKETVYYPVKIEMQNDTFKGYFYSKKKKELKVIFFKLKEEKL